MKRLNSDQEIAHVVAQFVPVKIDVDTPEYSLWQREHPSEGNTIPKLFVVRADNETLYGRSGALNGRDLPDMLVRALQNSGRVLSAREAAELNEAADQFEKLKHQGELAQAVRALKRVGNFGQPGKIPSFAASAARLNELVNSTADEIKAKLKELAAEIEGDNIDERLKAMIVFFELRRNYGGLKIVKSDLTVFQKKFTTKEFSQLAREAKLIDASISADTKSKQARSVERLRQLITETEFDEVKSEAERAIEKIESDNGLG